MPKGQGPEDIHYVDRLLAQLEPKAGLTRPILVHATTATSGATIRYTTNGSEPTMTSAVIPLGGITLKSAATVKAKAFKNGLVASETVTANFLPPSSAI